MQRLMNLNECKLRGRTARVGRTIARVLRKILSRSLHAQLNWRKIRSKLYFFELARFVESFFLFFYFPLSFPFSFFFRSARCFMKFPATT